MFDWYKWIIMWFIPPFSDRWRWRIFKLIVCVVVGSLPTPFLRTCVYVCVSLYVCMGVCVPVCVCRIKRNSNYMWPYLHIIWFSIFNSIKIYFYLCKHESKSSGVLQVPNGSQPVSSANMSRLSSVMFAVGLSLVAREYLMK